MVIDGETNLKDFNELLIKRQQKNTDANCITVKITNIRLYSDLKVRWSGQSPLNLDQIES